jgi:tight adherence protein C
MTALLVLGLMLIAAALLLLHIALRPGEATSGINRSLAVLEAMNNAPPELTREVAPGLGDRILVPLRAQALRLGRRLTGADYAERVRHRLDLAGNPAGLGVDQILAGKVLCAGLGVPVAALMALITHRAVLGWLVVLAIGAVAGFVAPDLYLYQKGYDRAERLRRALPDAIDLMTISVEAGLGFDAAVQPVSRNTDGPLAEEFARMLREMQLGQSRGEALRGLADRTRVDDIRSFVAAMVQADSFGIPIAQVLRVQSSEMRVRRRQRAEQRAQQVPVKITVPLIFCVLPALFVVVLGPAIVGYLAHDF